MNAAQLRVRRATVEDLDVLRGLWASMYLPVAALEPRLTEFQVVENAEGIIVGEIGFQISGSHGNLHDEGFTDFGIADAARELLWRRIQTLSSNHGILRLWMRENSLYWKQLGFEPATIEEIEKLPADWNTEGPAWLTLQLKNEDAINAVEKELAMFMTAQKRQSDHTMRQIHTFKTLALVMAAILILCACAGAVFLLVKRPDLLHPSR